MSGCRLKVRKRYGYELGLCTMIVEYLDKSPILICLKMARVYPGCQQMTL